MAGTTSSTPSSEMQQAKTPLVEEEHSPQNEVVLDSHRIDGREIFRKSLHILPAVVPLVFYYVPHHEQADPLSSVALVLLAVITLVLTVNFLALFKFVKRPGESNFISTVISYPAAIFFTLLIFPGNAEFACVVVVILALGDSAACIFGRLYGRSKLPWNSDKSWVGTISFVLVSAPIATIAFYIEAHAPYVSWQVAATCGMTASVAAALAESLRLQITDNLRVGLAAALGVSIPAALLGVLHTESFLFGLLG